MPWWTFDSITSAAARPPCFLNPYELSLLLADAAGDDAVPAAVGPRTIAEICARGWALVRALRPDDYLGSDGAAGDGAADDRRDAYRSQHHGRPLRLWLSLYQFSDQPPILLVTIGTDTTADFG